MLNELEYLRHKAAELEADRKHLKKALQQSEERFFKIFHASSNPMAITTVKEGRIIDLNEANAHLGGFTREELIGHTVTDLNLLADPEQREKLSRKMREDGAVHNFEVAIRTKAGDTRTVLMSLDPIVVNDEPCELGVTIDITEQKKEADDLRKSEEKYRMLVENSLQGLAIIQDSRIVFCNNTLAEITGYSMEELLSLSPNGVKALIHPDDQELIWQRYKDRVAGKSVPLRYEHRGIKKDGTEIWLGVYANAMEYNGRPAIQAAYIDITKRRRTEKALQDNERRFRSLVETTNDCIWEIDGDGIYTYVSPKVKDLLGYEPEYVTGKEPFDFMPKEEAARVLALFQDIIDSRRSFSGLQNVNMHRDGQEIVLETNGAPILDAQGNFLGYRGIDRDITYRKRAEDERENLQAQLAQAQKMESIGRLAGGVAHDFNNLLTVIKGYTELLLEDFATDDPKRADIEQIAKAGQQAASLTAQLLAFSRKQMLQPRTLNLNDVLDEMGEMLRRLIGEDIDLLTIFQPDLGLINADPGQLQQIVMNLAINARDAMPKGGEITIETANVNLDEDYFRRHPVVKKGSYVMLAISDSGVGMDMETQARIFEPFFTTKGKGKGTGLGLSTVYGIVKQSNGFIWVYSEPGKGTTFKTYFPRTESEIANVTAKNKSEPESRGWGTILIAEDEPVVRSLAVRILRGRGYNVLEASNGKEALDIARKYDRKIHLVLTDVVMPGMSGRDLVSQLESERTGIKALYISGYADNAIVHRGMLDSDIAFLQKPFAVESLARKVRALINS